jgi:hypothetical protein
MLPVIGLVLSIAPYDVAVLEHSAKPVLSGSNRRGHGAAPAGCIVFNPSYIHASPTFNRSGVLVRLCCGSTCTGHGSAPRSGLANDGLPAERIGFAPCDLQTGVCGDVLPSSEFNLDPASDSEDPRAFYYERSYYNFYYRKEHPGADCTDPQCTVRLAKSATPLDASSWKEVGTYPWHRNGCCAMKRRGERSYCIWGEGPGPFPGLGISYTLNLDGGVFTPANWSVAEGVDSPVTSDGRYLLPFGPSRQEVKLEAGTQLLQLGSGDWIHFYAAATPGWVPNGNYTAGFLVLDRDDPSKIIQRSRTHLLIPYYDYETLCNGAPDCEYRGERKNVIFLSSATPLPPSPTSPTGTDRFRLFFGGGDGNVGTAVVQVVLSPSGTRTARVSN